MFFLVFKKKGLTMATPASTRIIQLLYAPCGDIGGMPAGRTCPKCTSAFTTFSDFSSIEALVLKVLKDNLEFKVSEDKSSVPAATLEAVEKLIAANEAITKAFPSDKIASAIRSVLETITANTKK